MLVFVSSILRFALICGYFKKFHHNLTIDVAPAVSSSVY